MTKNIFPVPVFQSCFHPFTLIASGLELKVLGPFKDVSALVRYVYTFAVDFGRHFFPFHEKDT